MHFYDMPLGGGGTRHRKPNNSQRSQNTYQDNGTNSHSTEPSEETSTSSAGEYTQEQVESVKRYR